MDQLHEPTSLGGIWGTKYLQQEQQRRANSYSSPHELLPFLHTNKVMQQKHMLQSMPPQNLLSPLNMNYMSLHDSPTFGTPTTPHSPFDFHTLNLLIGSDTVPTQCRLQFSLHIQPSSSSSPLTWLRTNANSTASTESSPVCFTTHRRLNPSAESDQPSAFPFLSPTQNQSG
ncbi:unnamed protein product [Cyclocybe aegerita]|uniref:Uncharacterized protein n=1 Tax=Cyclocybe aegerita TaxID=1973307 RepID=A0A8S0WS84_CYCAE|nr:unnamed protein product [Cyclocybe aegerita]